jgi:hypothetical protein
MGLTVKWALPVLQVLLGSRVLQVLLGWVCRAVPVLLVLLDPLVLLGLLDKAVLVVFPAALDLWDNKGLVVVVDLKELQVKPVLLV